MLLAGCSVWASGSVSWICRRSSARCCQIYSEISEMKHHRPEGQPCRSSLRELLGALKPRRFYRKSIAFRNKDGKAWSYVFDNDSWIYIWSSLKTLLPGRALICKLPLSPWTRSHFVKDAMVAMAGNMTEGHTDSLVSGGINRIKALAALGQPPVVTIVYSTHPG